MSTDIAGVAHAQERERIAALLTHYPDLTDAELADVKGWFDREASPLDRGILAGDTDVAPQYDAFRKDHLDRFSRKDLLTVLLFVGIAGCVVGIIALMMP